MKKLSIAAAILFACGTFAFAQDATGSKTPAKKATTAKSTKKSTGTKKTTTKKSTAKSPTTTTTTDKK